MNNIHNYCMIKGKTTFHLRRIIFTQITFFPDFFLSFFVSSLIQAWLKIAHLFFVWKNTAGCFLLLLNETHLPITLRFLGSGFVAPVSLAHRSVGFLPVWLPPSSPSFLHAFTCPCIWKQLVLHVIMTVSFHLPKCTCKVCLLSSELTRPFCTKNN